MVKGILLGCLAAFVVAMAMPRQAVAFDVGVGPFNFHVPEGRGGYGPRYGHAPPRHSTHTARRKGDEAQEEIKADTPKPKLEEPAKGEPSIPAGHGPDLTPER
jgi:hypothetical protein